MLANGSVDPAFAPFVSMSDPDPIGSPHVWRVDALALSPGRLYVGGEFRWVGGTERMGLAALAPDSGAVLAWGPKHRGLVSGTSR